MDDINKKKNIYKYIIGISSIFLFLLIIVLVVYYSIFIHCKNMYSINTGSMEPTIRIGDVVKVKKQREYKVDDIITFKESNSYFDTYITHRIVQIAGDKIITKGDANYINDEAISKDQIIGKVVKIYGPNTLKAKALRLNTGVRLVILIIILVFNIVFVTLDVIFILKYKKLSKEVGVIEAKIY